MQLLFVPLISAVLHKKQAGNARVSVAAMSMTWFFNQSHPRFSPALIAALRSRSLSTPLSTAAAILPFFLNSLVFVALQNSGFCPL